eukprot:5175672-Heterocapsa_arctica.AAC.1
MIDVGNATERLLKGDTRDSTTKLPLLRPLGFWHRRQLCRVHGQVAGTMRSQTTNNMATTIMMGNMKDDELKTRKADGKKGKRKGRRMAKKGLAQDGATEQEQAAVDKGNDGCDPCGLRTFLRVALRRLGRSLRREAPL